MTRPSVRATPTLVTVPKVAPPMPPLPRVRSGLMTVKLAAAVVERFTRVPA
jgi:hypothetical protein